MLKHLQRIGHILPYLFFLLAAWIVHHQITHHHQMKEIFASLSDMPWPPILYAVGLTILNYLLLSAYDWLGIKYAEQKIPYPRIILASFIGYAISNNTGHALVSGTSVRYRFYGASGIGGWDILKIAVFSALTFLLAAFTLEAGLSLLFPEVMKEGLSEPSLVHTITLISAICLGVYWAGVLFFRTPIRIKDYELRMPKPWLAVMQTVVGVADLIMSSVILYIFLDQLAPMPFVGFLAIYAISLLAGIVSQVPGGLGVFEGSFMWLAGPEFSSADILSALVMYRIVYFFFPLVLAGIGMFIYEIRHHRERIAKGGLLLSTAMGGSLPTIFSLLLFVSGAMLLVSGSTPTVPGHMHWLRDFIPLPVMEISHLLGSFAGIVLLFLANAIRLRLDVAWYGCILMLALGAIASILKGFDITEASILILMLLLMAPTRRHFDRHASLMKVSLTPEWLAMIAIVLIGCTWIGFFSYRHVEYANQMWWQFSYKDDAPRFMRALVFSIALATAYALYNLLTVARAVKIPLPSAEELDRAAAIARQGGDTDGFLALLGDKSLLWSDDNRAFIMYATTPKYWIAMSDPTGAPESFTELAWKFKELADRNGAQASFYQVSDRHLPLYLDLGLVMVKVGESAKVDLKIFSLAGGKRENQRKGRNRFLKQGYTFRILDAAEMKEKMPRLREISNLWLARKNVREKGFSLGFFEEDYILRTKVAVIEKDGTVEAFANFWDLDNRTGLAVDLMRYAPDTPPGLMEFLFVEMILWGQTEGYDWFGLGMAPLSGLEKHQLAPLWHKIGNVIFEHGEDFYNFEGLYAYKSKFDPSWQPRYLAVPSAMHIPLVLMNVASVISGGLQGVFRK